LDAADRRELIEELCSFEDRWPGTDAERRAANRLAERLRATGRRVAIEPTCVHPEYSLVIAAHALLAIVRCPSIPTETVRSCTARSRSSSS
jgi:hypothetical protein